MTDILQPSQVLIRSISSSYQLESFREFSETVTANLKGYLHAALTFVGHMNNLISKQGRSSPVQSLELDSLVSRQVFTLQAELCVCMSRSFSTFQTELSTLLGKSFALDSQSVHQIKITRLFEQISKQRQNVTRKVQKVAYSSLQRFVADVPSRTRSHQTSGKSAIFLTIQRSLQTSASQTASNWVNTWKYKL